LLHYTHSPLSFLEGCARRFGDPFTIRLAGYGKLVMLTDLEALRDVFRGDGHVLHSGEGNEFFSITVGPNSVLVLDDEPHARQRRILLPPLKGERMRSFFEAMRTATREALSAWPVLQPVAALDTTRWITLRVILQAVLGLPAGPRLEDFERKIERVLELGRGRYGLILLKMLPIRLMQRSRWLSYFRRLDDFDQTLFAFLAEQRCRPAAERGENVLADLLTATHEDGAPLTDVEIRDAIITLLLAGHDTTSIALAWALEQIVPRPDVVGRITEELRQVTGGGPPEADQLPRLEYLDAAIRESMRVRTIIPFVVRLTKQPYVAGGREYPPGVLLSPCNHLVHRRPDLYPEPDKFRPERFLERKYAGHEWFPFGGGNRTCLGMAFALYEMKVVLATLFAQVRLARPEGSASHSIRRGISLAPHDGTRVVVVEKVKMPG
jgi:unspecific monooxygenase